MGGTDLSMLKNVRTDTFARTAKPPRPDDPAAPRPEGPEPARRTGEPAFALSRTLKDRLDERDMVEVAKGAEVALANLKSLAHLAPPHDLERAMAGAARDLDRLLKAMGVDEKERKAACRGLIGGLGQPDEALAATAPATPTVSRPPSDTTTTLHTEGVSLSVAVRNIDIQIKDDDRSLSIHYESASVSVGVWESDISKTSGRGGSSFTLTGQSTTLSTTRTGLVIEAEGYSPDELKEVLGQVNKMIGGQEGGSTLEPLEGLAVLRPKGRPGGDDSFGFALDLIQNLAAERPRANGGASPRLDLRT